MTYTCQWHHIVINLPIGRPYAPPSYVNPDKDGQEADRKEGELLCDSHVCDLEYSKVRCSRCFHAKWSLQH